MVWDDIKLEANLREHRMDFADARDRFEWDTAIIALTYPSRHGSARFIAVGQLDGAIVTLVFSPLGTEAVSAISLHHRATRSGDDMSKARRTVPMLSDEKEARLQEQIANDPDNPEMTDEELAAMRPASEVLPPALYAALTRPRGRPKADVTKVPVKLRLDRSALEAFKATGPGWQTRMNNTLVAAAKRLRKRA